MPGRVSPGPAPSVHRVAYCLIRHRTPYPWESVEAGIRVSGDLVADGYCDQRGSPSSVAVTWHPYRTSLRVAEAVKSGGGRHVVFENGYVRTNSKGERYYLAELDGFNGRGRHPVPEIGPARWETFHVKHSPWKRGGKHVLVCGQMGGSYSEYAMPNFWPDRVLAELRRHTDRPIVYRPHPVRRRLPDMAHQGVVISDPSRPLSEDLEGAHACVVWTSNSATEALIAGIPVFYEGPTLKLGSLARRGVSRIEAPAYPDREPALWELAWSQWTKDEIKTGMPWGLLMEARREFSGVSG